MFRPAIYMPAPLFRIPAGNDGIPDGNNFSLSMPALS
jgi:hypothetical protein